MTTLGQLHIGNLVDSRVNASHLGALGFRGSRVLLLQQNEFLKSKAIWRFPLRGAPT